MARLPILVFLALFCIISNDLIGVDMRNYTVLLHREVLTRVNDYRVSLLKGGKPGAHLAKVLEGCDLAALTPEAFLEKLVQTKKPMIFAESAVAGNGSDWSLVELSLLGFVSIAVPVTIFDNGQHEKPEIHKQPFSGTLLFTAGALLDTGSEDAPPADWDAVTAIGKIDAEAYYRFYEKRLLPVFAYADRLAAEKGRKALITVPGVGCGMFAGPFKGLLGQELEKTFFRFLHQHARTFKNIRALFYGPFNECDNARHEINGITYLVRPFLKGNHTRPQLCHPSAYSEGVDDFSDCEFFSIVAWDHVSWPGNDFYGGTRSTDDGVKAAATSSMLGMTGVAGVYDPETFCYQPPDGFQNWSQVVAASRLELEVLNRLYVYP